MQESKSLLTFSDRLGENPPLWQKVLPYALLLSVTFALYGSSLYFDFEWDDHSYVSDNFWIFKLNLRHLLAIWSAPYLGHYAPINLTFLAVVYRLFGMDPFGFHLAQLSLHAVCLCLVYATLKRIESPRIALLATLLFAVHPTGAETVAWIAETKSTLAFLFFLLAFLCFVRQRVTGERHYTMLCTLLLILSFLSKINTVVAPAIFLLYDYREKRVFDKKSILNLAWYFVLSAIFVAIHLSSFFWSKTTFVKTNLEGSYFGGPLVHIANIPAMLAFYVKTIFIPRELSVWHMFAAQQSLNRIVALGWLALLAFLVALLWCSRDTQFWSLWFLIFLAPVLQIIPNLTWVADRYLYIPAIGIFVLCGKAFFALWDRLRKSSLRIASECAAIFILCLLAIKTVSYLPAFRNDLTLWSMANKTCSMSASCRSGLGAALLDAGQIEPGIRELIKALEIRPLPDHYGFLGDAFALQAHDLRQALIAYKLGLEHPANTPISRQRLYVKQARAYLMSGETESALASVQSALTLNPEDVGTLVTLSFCEWKRGDVRAARIALDKALFLSDQSSAIGSFLLSYWKVPADVGKFLAAIGTQSPNAS